MTVLKLLERAVVALEKMASAQRDMADLAVDGWQRKNDLRMRRRTPALRQVHRPTIAEMNEEWEQEQQQLEEGFGDDY